MQRVPSTDFKGKSYAPNTLESLITRVQHKCQFLGEAPSTLLCCLLSLLNRNSLLCLVLRSMRLACVIPYRC